MRESTSTTTAELDVVNPHTGEMFTVSGKTTEVSKYYSIKKITTRINQMDFTTALFTICKSELQGRVLASLLDSLDSDNRLLVLNQVELAKSLGISVKTLKTVLYNLGESELAVKQSTGLYVINPFIFIGRRTRSNEQREQLQTEWPLVSF